MIHLTKNLRRTAIRPAFAAGLLCTTLIAAGSFAAPSKIPAIRCMADGKGFFRARISGSINAELDWGNQGMECTGATRPSGGVRVRFSHAFEGKDKQLVFLFGIPGLSEGQVARNLPVHLTVILQGAGQFYGTTGEDKCAIDEVRQEAITGIPRRNRSYRVVARGFCMQPAPAVRGTGSVLVSRFDFSGHIDFSEEDDAPDEPSVVKGGP